MGSGGSACLYFGTWILESSPVGKWDHLNREKNKRQPTFIEEFWNAFQEAWRNICEDYLKSESLPKKF